MSAFLQAIDDWCQTVAFFYDFKTDDDELIWFNIPAFHSDVPICQCAVVLLLIRTNIHCGQTFLSLIHSTKQQQQQLRYCYLTWCNLYVWWIILLIKAMFILLQGSPLFLKSSKHSCLQFSWSNAGAFYFSSDWCVAWQKEAKNKRWNFELSRCCFPGYRLRTLPKEKINKATSGVFQRKRKESIKSIGSSPRMSTRMS